MLLDPCQSRTEALKRESERTRFRTETRAREKELDDAKSPYRSGRDEHGPPIDLHLADVANESLEQKEEAEFDGEDGGERQDEKGGAEFAKPFDLVEDIRRYDGVRVIGDQGFQHIHGGSTGEQQPQGHDQAHDCKYQEGIIDGETFLIAQPDCDSADGENDCQHEERDGRSLFSISPLR